MAHRMFDRGVADRERAFRHRLIGVLGNLRQPRLVILLGAGHGGIDIRGSRILCRILRRQVRLPPQFGTVPRQRRP